MATVLTYLNESLNEDLSAVKIVLYSLPVCFCSDLFIKGEMGALYFWATLFGIIFLGVLTKAINNVRTNKTEILTLNPLRLLVSIALSLICVIPQILIFGGIGLLLVKFIPLPVEIPHFQLIFNIVIWSIAASIVLTSYLSFAKYLNPLEAFNYKVVFSSCIDILISVIFFVPQIILMNLVLIGPALVLCSQFGISYTHWALVFYYSIIFVVNISVLANYFAQSSFEHIKESNRYYDENIKLNDVIDDIAERLQ